MDDQVELHSHVKVDSISVPNVQALAASLNSSSQVPQRYFRAEAEAEPVLHGDEIELPVIDLARLVDKEFSADEAAKLHSTCKDWGFFQLVNHGIPEELIERLKADVIEFFSKPFEEKKTYEQRPGSLEGYGQAFVHSDEQKLEWADMLFLVTRPVSLRNMKFGLLALPLSDTLGRYSREVKDLTKCLLRCIAKNLSIEPERFEQIFKDQPQSMRFNYYPPCPEASRVLGTSAHSDAVGLTVLLQINDVQGLQISKDGNWITVNALQNALIVNIGDIVEILSNGIYRSTRHRVIINNTKERLSVAAFHGADQDTMVEPLPEIVRSGKQNYRSISYKEFMEALFSQKFGSYLPDWLRL